MKTSATGARQGDPRTGELGELGVVERADHAIDDGWRNPLQRRPGLGNAAEMSVRRRESDQRPEVPGQQLRGLAVQDDRLLESAQPEQRPRHAVQDVGPVWRARIEAKGRLEM